MSENVEKRYETDIYIYIYIYILKHVSACIKKASSDNVKHLEKVYTHSTIKCFVFMYLRSEHYGQNRNHIGANHRIKLQM